MNKKIIIFLLLFSCVVITLTLSAIAYIFYPQNTQTGRDSGDVVGSSEDLEEDNTEEPESTKLEIQSSSKGFHNNLTPAQESSLGIAGTPETSKKVTTIKGINIYETENHQATDLKLAQLETFLERTPDVFFETPPKAIIFGSKADVKSFGLFNPLIAAFSSGPYIYLTPQSFDGAMLSAGMSNTEVYRLFLHEWMHVVQFHNIPEDSIKEELAKGYFTKSYLNQIRESDFLKDFGILVGWEAQQTSSSTNWKLQGDDDSQAISSYGRGSMIEDQAETVSYYFTGKADHISPQRTKWVSDWGQVSTTQAKQGFAPEHPTSDLIKTGSNTLDEFLQELQEDYDIVSKTQLRVRYRDIGYRELISWYESELPTRGFKINESKNWTARGYLHESLDVSLDKDFRVIIHFWSPERDVEQAKEIGFTYINIAYGEVSK